jgi:integrase
MRSPEELGEAEIRQFLLHQVEVKHLSYAAYRQIYAALKFLYAVTLKRAWEVEHLPFPKPQHRPLPVVLHPEELVTLFQAVRRPKYRTLFMTCYAAGLRIDEACHLRIADIDSKQMLLHVRHAKGGQERVTLLSAKLLDVLRDYRHGRPTRPCGTRPGAAGRGLAAA